MKNRVLITAIFFASGAASLILQVLWFKQLQFVLGSATVSVSVTVASFFFGLSLGSALGGRIADAVSRPLKFHMACLEIALAPVSFAVTALLAQWPTWVGWLSPMLDLESPLRLPVMAALSLAILTVPTMLMGATLPFLVKSLTRSQTDLANRIGFLYGFNTLGAATGTLLVGFLASWDHWGSQHTRSSLVSHRSFAISVCRRPGPDDRPRRNAPCRRRRRQMV